MQMVIDFCLLPTPKGTRLVLISSDGSEGHSAEEGKGAEVGKWEVLVLLRQQGQRMDSYHQHWLRMSVSISQPRDARKPLPDTRHAEKGPAVHQGLGAVLPRVLVYFGTCYGEKTNPPVYRINHCAEAEQTPATRWR